MWISELLWSESDSRGPGSTLPGAPGGSAKRGGRMDVPTNKKEVRKTLSDLFFICGDKEIRTPDPLLAKQVLYQLSYTPEEK